MTRLRGAYYGWIVVAGLCVTETVSWGILYYGFPVLLRPMEADLGFSRVAVTGAFSVGMGLAALAALPVGRWIDRHGARALMTLGSCLGALLLLVWSRVESLPALYAVWCLMGFVLAATLYEPAFAAIVGWFVTGPRDRALLTLTLAAGFASTIFMPIEAWLVERLGWRSTLVTLAVVLAVLTIPIHAFLLRPPPRPEPHATGAARGEADVPGFTLAATARTAVFWVLALAFFVGNFTTNSVTVHLIPYLVDRGYSATLAAVMIGWMGAMQVPARLLFAPIAARFGHHAVTAAIFLTQAAALAQLALAAKLPTLVPMVVMLGAANGMSTLARATTIAEIFGPRHYGAISGAVALGANGARAVAPVGAALLQVALGGYERVFWLLTATLVAAGIAVMLTDARAGR
ncbi:MAG: MFS transporter [Candidatus Rokubacteria bacterium]|nr:MFS transporter [Candidatus Rokubacteria bacterium]